MTVTIHPVNQNSEAWFKLREKDITGSIADKLLTIGRKETLKENAKPNRSTFYTKRGHVLEQEALELYEAIHGVKVTRPGYVTNSKYKDAGCSPDAIDGEYLLEVKAFAEKNHNLIKNRKSIPMKIMAQIQFNMMICEKTVAKLIMYNPDLAKKTIFVNGLEIPNPDYNIKQAYREIFVGENKKIQANLKRKLKA